MFCRLPLETEIDEMVALTRMHAEEMGQIASEERTRETFQNYLDTANPTIFVVEDKRELIGYLLASMNLFRHKAGFSTTQELLYVRPDKRGSRAAVLLVKDFCSWSDRLGASESTGGVDRGPYTERTERLLSHFGFSTVGVVMRRVGDGR